MAVLARAWLRPEPVSRVGRRRCFGSGSVAAGMLIKGPVGPMVAGLTVAMLTVRAQLNPGGVAGRPAVRPRACAAAAGHRAWRRGSPLLAWPRMGAFFSRRGWRRPRRASWRADRRAHGALAGAFTLLLLPLLAFPVQPAPVVLGLAAAWRTAQPTPRRCGF